MSITRTTVLTERMHAVLMHALDCAGYYSFEEEWTPDEKHMHGAFNSIPEPLDDRSDLRKLRNICKAAKIATVPETGPAARLAVLRIANELMNTGREEDVARELYDIANDLDVAFGGVAGR